MKALDIVIAEDNDDHAEMIVESLEEYNPKNTITRCSNGEELLKLLEQRSAAQSGNPPDLVLLDIKMPGLGGINVLRSIKSNATLKAIPVMMVSTSNHNADIRKCYELGANSYIVKPFDYKTFANKIHELNAYWAKVSETPNT